MGHRIRPTQHVARLIRIILMISVLFLSGCAGNTRPAVKIGLLAPFTGYDEAVGYGVLPAVKLALREANQQGGVAGHDLELIALDDRSDPAVAVAQARSLAIDAAILGVVGPLDPGLAMAVAPVADETGLVFLSPATPAPALTGGHLFRLGASETAIAGEMVRLAGRLNSRRLAILGDREASGLAQTVAHQAQAAGFTVVWRSDVARWQLDFTALVGEVRRASPDLILWAGRAAEGGEFLRQARAAGLRTPLAGGPGLDDRRLLGIAGPAAEGVAYVGLFRETSGWPAGEALLTAYQGQRPAGAYAPLAYDATRLLIEAVGRALPGRPTNPRAAVLKVLQGQTPGPLPRAGLTGDLTLTPQGSRSLVTLYHLRLSGNRYPGALLP